MPDSIYSFPNNISASIKLDAYGALLDFLSAYACDIRSLDLPTHRCLFSETKANLISRFHQNHLNVFYNTLQSCKMQYIGNLPQSIINYSFVYLDHICALPSQTKNKQAIDLLKFHYLKNPENFTLVYMYYNLVHENDESPSFLKRLKLRKLLYDHLHETFRANTEIHVSPFYAIGLAHIWPFLHVRALCNAGVLPSVEKFNIWADPVWSMNQPLENILGSITYIGPNQLPDCSVNLLATYFEQKYLLDVRIGMPAQINATYTHSLKSQLSKSLFSVDSHKIAFDDDSIDYVPIHIRTAQFKPDTVLQQSIRNTDPSTLLLLTNYLSMNGYKPILCSAGKLICDSALDIAEHLVVNDDSYINQIRLITKSHAFIGTQSGLSHLWMCGDPQMLFINMCSLLIDSSVPDSHLFLCKSLSSTGDFPSSRRLLVELLLSDWVDPSFQKYFNVSDNTSYEILEAYQAFQNINYATYPFSLYSLLFPYLSTSELKCLPRRYLSSKTFNVLSSLLQSPNC